MKKTKKLRSSDDDTSKSELIMIPQSIDTFVGNSEVSVQQSVQQRPVRY